MVTPVSPTGAPNPELMPAVDMAAILGDILKKHGKAVLEDRRRTLGLLHDYVPGEARGVHLLMSAFDADVPKDLMTEDGAPNEFKLEQQASSLVADSGLQVELARWAVAVWSGALTGTLPAAAPSPPTTAAGGPTEAVPVAPTVSLAPSANDLTWDDQTPSSPGAAAPNSSSTSSRPINRRLATIGAVAGLIVAISHFSYLWSSPAPHPKAQPAHPAPQHQPHPAVHTPRHTAGPATPPAQKAPANVQVASMSQNPNNWPKFAGATHPNNNPNAWRFRFNLRTDDGRVMIYAVNVAMSSNEQSGTGTVRALDYRYANRAAQMLSSTPSLTVSRTQEPKSKVYFTRIGTVAWAKNPSQAPKVCIVFSSGTQLQQFNPDNGMFCAFDVQGNKCGQKLGCGRL